MAGFALAMNARNAGVGSWMRSSMEISNQWWYAAPLANPARCCIESVRWFPGVCIR